MHRRIAVIGDIHGNADALRAVLAEIDRRSIDAILNLGDLFSGPLDPAATADILAGRAIPTLRGNHDRVLTAVAPALMSASDRVAYDALSSDTLAWLGGLTEHLELGADIFACHGTPLSDETYWIEQVTATGRVRLRQRVEIEALAVTLPFQVLLCGHSHLPRMLTLSSGQLLINPGSVGCPAYGDDVPVPHKIETGSAEASFAILECRGGLWSGELCKVAYDTGLMVTCARKNLREDWARAVETGRI